MLYKLDGGLDHILVDEAQDTSPVQWDVIRALAEEFFSGSGAREEVRTLFAVGDEKQSIYSFQGAAPTMFAGMAEAFAQPRLACGLRAAPRAAELVVSRRRAAVGGGGRDLRRPRAHAGGHLFRDADPACRPSRRARGADRDLADREVGAGRAVRALVSARRGHRVLAGGAAGGTHRPDHPRLARRPAEMLASENRPIRAGDILILVRKRTPFAPAMISALKARGIKVAGADRLVLTEQIAVQDLMALGDFLCLPEDDLALASVLKSPLFGLDDDDLLALAPKRQGFLWQELVARAGTEARFRGPAETLKRWRARADRVPPFEFFSALLDADGMRAQDAGASRRRGGRRHRRAPQPGARLRRRRRALPAGLPQLAARGHPRHQARHGAGARRGARHDRARRQGPGGAHRVPARHLLDAIGAAAGQPRSKLDDGQARPTPGALRLAGQRHERPCSPCSRRRRRLPGPRRRSATGCSTWR